MEYSNVDLDISDAALGQFKVRVLSSLGGETQEVVDSPIGADDAVVFASLCQAATLSPGAKPDGAVDYTGEQLLRALGQRLFETLFVRSVKDVCERSAAVANERGQGIRYRVRTTSGVAALLPWELMLDRGGAPVTMSGGTPFVRYPERVGGARPAAGRPPLKVLGIVSSPRDQKPLDVDGERAIVDRAVAGLAQQGRVSLSWVDGTWDAFVAALQQDEWNVLHFIGHGGASSSGAGVLAFENEDQTTREVSGEELRGLLASEGALSTVVLNSCQGAMGGAAFGRPLSAAAAIADAGAPVVVAMQYEISDGAALQFAFNFYSYLASGMPVDVAMANTRAAMGRALGGFEWATPSLFLRADDAAVFATEVERPGSLEPMWQIQRVGNQHFRSEGVIQLGLADLVMRAQQALRTMGAVSVDLRGANTLVARFGVLPLKFAATEEVAVEATAGSSGGATAVVVSSHSTQFMISDYGKNEQHVRELLGLLGVRA